MKEKYDYTKLKCKMKDKGYGIRSLAKELPMAASTLSTKLSGHYEFTVKEILKICFVLDISKIDITEYFFDKEVRNIEPPIALAIAMQNAFKPSDLRRIWTIIDGEPVGPYWEMTFTHLSE